MPLTRRQALLHRSMFHLNLWTGLAVLALGAWAFPRTALVLALVLVAWAFIGSRPSVHRALGMHALDDDEALEAILRKR